MATLENRFKDMPQNVRIACLACFGLGVLQLLALIVPALSPQIDGVKLSSPILIIIMGVSHFALGLGIFTKIETGEHPHNYSSFVSILHTVLGYTAPRYKRTMNQYRNLNLLGYFLFGLLFLSWGMVVL